MIFTYDTFSVLRILNYFFKKRFNKYLFLYNNFSNIIVGQPGTPGIPSQPSYQKPNPPTYPVKPTYPSQPSYSGYPGSSGKYNLKKKPFAIIFLIGRYKFKNKIASLCYLNSKLLLNYVINFKHLNGI